MEQRHRLAWLAAMGIDCWIPRDAPDVFELEEQTRCPQQTTGQADSPVVSGTTAAQPAERPARSDTADSAAQKLLAEIAPPETTPALQDSPPTSNALLVRKASRGTADASQAAARENSDQSARSRATDQQTAPFRLAAINVNQDCLAIVDLPWSGVNQFTDVHAQLLSNILRALDIAMEPLSQPGVFSWPMLPGTATPDQDYAREAVQAWLGNQYGLSRRKTLLVFGRAGYACLQDDPASFDSRCGFHCLSGINWGITCSLGEMLHIPRLKAEAWSHLRPLAAHRSGETGKNTADTHSGGTKDHEPLR